MAGNLLIIGLSLLVLFIGFKWGIIGIHNGSVGRKENPVLFWMAMALAVICLASGTMLAITGN